MPHECTTCGRQFDDGSKEMLSGCPNCGGNKFQFQPAGRGGDEPAAGSDTDPDTRESSSADDDGERGVTESDVAEADVEREMPELAKEGNERASDSAASDSPAETTDGDAAPGFAERARAFEAEFRDAEIDDEVGEENRAQTDARSASASIDEIDQARRKMAEAEEERLSEAEEERLSEAEEERLSEAEEERLSEAEEEQLSDGVPGGRGTPQGPRTETPPGEESDEFDVSGAVGPDDGDPVEKQPVAGSAPEREQPVSETDTDLTALREELNDQFESIKITAPGQYELNLMELYNRKEYIISLQEDGRYVIEMTDSYGMEDA